jgi:hypothetical protein
MKDIMYYLSSCAWAMAIYRLSHLMFHISVIYRLSYLCLIFKIEAVLMQWEGMKAVIDSLCFKVISIKTRHH